MPRRLKAAFAGTLMALVLVAAPPAARADRAPAQLADQLARRIVDAWMVLQRSDGSFLDYVADRDTAARDVYGPEMLGTGLLLHGLRTGRPQPVDAGLRAIRFAVGRHDGSGKSLLGPLALAEGYRVAQLALPDDERRLELDRAWRTRLLSYDSKLGHSAARDRYRGYNNRLLIDLLAALQGRAAGLAATRPRALFHGSAIVEQVTRGVLGRTLPALAALQQRPSRAGPTTLISDPPCNPVAYHALSLGLLARIVDTVGDRAPPSARGVLVRAARASWALMSPQGDVAWWGRGQAQSWTLALTAVGAIGASRQPGVAAAERRRFRAVALRALDRLATAYPSQQSGLWIMPAFAQDPVAAIGGLDWYAAAAAYTGLTLVALEWLAANPIAYRPAPETGIAADTDGGAVLGRTGAFATVREGDVWMAVKQCPAVPDPGKVDHTKDLRYDAGAGLVLIHAPRGPWEPVLRAHPRTDHWDATGPVLELHGQRARMVGHNTHFAGGGTIVVAARFRTHAGRTVRSTDVRFKPTRCGIRIEVTGREGDVWEHSAFYAVRPLRLGRRAVTDGQTVFRANAPARISFSSGYASALDARLVRARLRVRLTGRKRVTFEACRNATVR